MNDTDPMTSVVRPLLTAYEGVGPGIARAHPAQEGGALAPPTGPRGAAGAFMRVCC